MSELPSALLARYAGATVGDYLQILKPRVMSLVVFTGFVGLYLAPGHLHPFLALVAVLCIAVGAGASGAINMWYDRDIDAVMRPRGIGRLAVRVILASMSPSSAMFSAPEAPAPTAMHSSEVKASTGWKWPGAITSPTSAVKITSDITRGFNSAT